ncbi:MAG: hypothetical protein DCF19_12200 [Pseudanabaena frigida]|uniref:Circadian input-output histidine kinase CikA n=1 Tax=Pseudanabaena frigida TaxID=945775 RepID=A0A2W4W862_9CYAN|nr:MAG: hypothetical protein DCF19_12200 [Pseudanabaena frigida]
MSAKNQKVSIEQAIVRNPLNISANSTVADAIALINLENRARKWDEIDPESSFQLAQQKNSQQKNNCILVTEGKKLIGILTKRDLVKLYDRNGDQNKSSQNLSKSLAETLVEEVMISPVHSLCESELTDIIVPIKQLYRYDIKYLPLVNDIGEVVGLLTDENLRKLIRPIDMLRLSRVSEVMITNVVHALPNDSIAEILNLMSVHNVSLVVIVEKQDCNLIPLGIITEGDLFQYLVLDSDLTATQAQMVMNSPVVSVSKHETLWSVRELMQEHEIDRIIVTKPTGQIEGIISQSDLLRAIQLTLPKKSAPIVLGDSINITYNETELALRKSESNQQALINALPDLIIRMSGEGVYLDFSSTDTFEVFGNEDLIGTSIYDCGLPQSLVETRMHYIHETLRTGDIRIYDQEIIINGKLNIEEVRIAVCGENEVIVIVRDISDRKQAEIALQQSEQRLKASESLLSGMFKRSVVGIAITDIDGKFVRTNPFYQQMVGYSESELELMRFTDNMLPEDIAENLRLRDLVLFDQCESYQMEKRLLHRDGRVIWVRTTSSKIFDEVNQSPLFIGVIEDISDRKQAEVERQEAIDALYQLNQQLESRVEQRTRELKFSNQQLMVEMAERQKLIALVENSTDFIALADCDGWLNYVNTAGRELVGMQDITKTFSIFDLHFPEDCPELKRNIIDLIAREETWEGEFRLRHCQTHEAIPVLFSAFPVQNSWADETFSLAYIVRDISERKKAEEIVIRTNEALICTNTDLARATRLKDEFLANMSHELRTPLNAILGMSEGLMSGVFGDVNERQKRSLLLIESSGQHLLELINDILDVAKIGSGKLKLEASPVAIKYLCKSSLNFVKQMANQKNIQLSLSVQNNLGAITVDERRIKQALINLLSNAVKFTPIRGKVSLEVKLVRAEETSLTLTAEFPYVLSFSVIDNGIGIAPENLNKLFQTFVQIDSSLNRQYAGTGLGLTLVKQIAELHDGYVSVTSKVGEGSRFSILLPYAGKVRSNNLDRVSSLPTDSLSETIGLEHNLEIHEMLHPLILLAEDNQTNIETFSDYLTNKGYRLIFALNGQEAVNMAIAQVPDLILMDIQMPVLDGLGAIQQIRSKQNLSQIPIVALTALAMASDREKCLQAGADEYLSKPVKLSQLAAIIQLQLQKTKIH